MLRDYFCLNWSAKPGRSPCDCASFNIRSVFIPRNVFKLDGVTKRN